MTKPPSFGSQLNRHLMNKQIELTGRRFCTSHQGMASAKGGSMRGARWCCATCTANRLNRIQAWKK